MIVLLHVPMQFNVSKISIGFTPRLHRMCGASSATMYRTRRVPAVDVWHSESRINIAQRGCLATRPHTTVCS